MSWAMSCLMFAYEILSFRCQTLAYPDHLAFLTHIPKEGRFLPFHFSFLIPSFIQGVIQTHGLTRATSRGKSLDVHVHSRNTRRVLQRGRNVQLFLNTFYILTSFLSPLPIKLQAKKKLLIKFLTIHLKRVHPCLELSQYANFKEGRV